MKQLDFALCDCGSAMPAGWKRRRGVDVHCGSLECAACGIVWFVWIRWDVEAITKRRLTSIHKKPRQQAQHEADPERK